MTRLALDFKIPADGTKNSHCPEVSVSVDDDGDTIIVTEEGTIMLTYAQAHALVMNLHQKYIEFNRSFGFRYDNLKALA